MNNWIEVSGPRLAANLRVISQVAGPEATVLAVIKANAYGHGAPRCAPILARAGARWLGVTSTAEGAEVRSALALAGIDPQPEILVMCGLQAEGAAAVVAHRLTPVVWTSEHLSCLAAAGMKGPVHVEVDTGMSRQGVRPGADLDALLAHIQTLPFPLGGVFTHFSSSEIANSAFTRQQQGLFEQALDAVAASGLRPAWVHAENTSAVDNPVEPQWMARLAGRLGASMLVRCGLALYGHTLPIEGEGSPRLHSRLAPVLTWKTRVVDVRELAVGDSVGYNATFTATRPMRIALLTVGYADGLRRELSQGGWMVLHGARAPILGRISMNLTTVDVTCIPEVRIGDEAVILGEGISAEDHARLAGTIPYEILCGVHPCP